MSNSQCDADDTCEIHGTRCVPFHNGMPVVIRLSRGHDVLCVAYRMLDAEGIPDNMVLMERPIVIIPTMDTTDREHTTGPTPALRVERWFSTSNDQAFEVMTEQVITMGSLAFVMVNAYMDWAEEIYSSRDLKADMADRYADLLRTFTPTGDSN